MKYRRSASEVAQELQEKFGYIVLGTDDVLNIGERIPTLVSMGHSDDSTSSVVIGLTTYRDYKKQAAFAGFRDTCTDCFDHYYKIKLVPEERLREVVSK